ncbi:DUF1007 family protein [Vibrio sp.]|nr:DUF1007 family protein [Vibrio sp.]
MFSRCFFKCCSALVLVASLSFSTGIAAHPHSWIDMKTYVKGDDKQLTGFNMIWSFDPMTTAYLFDGEDMSPKHREATLKKLAASVIENMMTTHYFTFFYDGKTPIRYEKVHKATLTESKGKATLEFELDLAKPYPYNGHPLQLRIFDPTYYVDISWKTKADVILDADVQSHCTGKLKQPNPTPAQVSYALSIPPDADPDNTLGQLFTQTFYITCKS